MSHEYAHLSGPPLWACGRGRIVAGETIKLFKNGDIKRDFTYVDDGRSRPCSLNDYAAGLANSSGAYVRLLEEASRKNAKCELLPVQPGDVPATYADIGDLVHDVNFVPVTPIEEGIARFIDWHRSYHRL